MPPVAPHRYVAAEIRRRIDSGTWTPGQQLPSRAQLASELGVTAGAVRRGMELLRRTGELEGTARSRLWVAHPPAVRTLIDADANWPYLTGDGGGIGSCTATTDLAGRLDVPTGTRLHWERVECLDPDSRPSHLLTTWWRGRRASAWGKSESVAEFHQLTIAEADQLGLGTGVQAWLVQRTRYSPVGRPVETADMVLPVDRWHMRLG